MNKEEYEKTIKNLNDDATRLLEISKQDKEELELKSKVIRNLLKRISNLEYEVERLNNIINEFETLIKHEITESIFEDNYGRVDAMEYCLATLRELKGEDKE